MVKALRGRVARVVVSLALAVGAVFVAVLPASPAAAASGHLCFPVSGNGPTQRWQCVAMHVQLCKAPCGLWAIDLKEAIVLPYEEELGYVTALGNGLSLVSAAGVERDPAVAARLLEEAKVQFLAAASILDGTRVTVGEVGCLQGPPGEVTAADQVPGQPAGGGGPGQHQRVVGHAGLIRADKADHHAGGVRVGPLAIGRGQAPGQARGQAPGQSGREVPGGRGGEGSGRRGRDIAVG